MQPSQCLTQKPPNQGGPHSPYTATLVALFSTSFPSGSEPVRHLERSSQRHTLVTVFERVCLAGWAGCGKTTLLSVLAGSVSSLSANSRVYGHVTLDGQPRRSWASRLVAYVPQFDFLLPTLTVAETLRYSAQLRLPRTATAAEVKVVLSETMHTSALSEWDLSALCALEALAVHTAGH